MTTENDYEKLKELMEFPAAMTFKVAGVNRENLAQDIVAVIQKYLPGDYIPKEKRSSKGTYNSISIVRSFHIPFLFHNVIENSI